MSHYYCLPVNDNKGDGAFQEGSKYKWKAKAGMPFFYASFQLRMVDL